MNIGAYNSTTFNGGAASTASIEVVQASVVVDLTVSAFLVQPQRWVEITVIGSVQVTQPVQIDVVYPVFQPAISVTMSVWGTASASAVIELQVIDANTQPPAVIAATGAYYWRAGVVMGGVDVSARLTGSIDLSHEEDSSGIAELRLVPEQGETDYLQLVGEAVTIDYVATDADGNELWRSRRFTGVISDPVFNGDQGLLVIICTTDLQGRFNALTREQIDTIVGGQWSEHVFDDDVSPYNYALDRLSTLAASVWIDVNGEFALTDWTAKATADIAVSDADRQANSVEVERAAKADLVNRIVSTIDFRFQRLKQRLVHYTLATPLSICDYLQNQFKLPDRAAVSSAVEGTGWDLQGRIGYSDVWPAGVYRCGRGADGEQDIRVWGYTDSSGLGAPDPALASLCLGASFTLGKRFEQTVTETYVLDVSAPSSVAANGHHALADGYGLEVDNALVHWEVDKSYTASISGSGNTTVGSGGSMDAMPAGAVELDNGDLMFEASEGEVIGRHALEQSLTCLLARNRVEILASHRLNRVHCSMPFNPDIDLSTTVSITTANMRAKGKVSAVFERFDIASGEALSEVSLAISRAGAAGVYSDTPFVVPDVPISDPLTVYDRRVSLRYRIGGSVTSQPFDDEWDGYITNYLFDNENDNPFSTDPNNPDTVIYPESMRVATPEIGEVDRNAIGAVASSDYTTVIPDDLLMENV